MVKLSELIAPAFFQAHSDICNQKYTHYWFKGGRGSCKSSFISIEIILGMMTDPNANAVALRKIGNNLKDSVFEQLLWAIDMLGVSDYWEERQTPPKLSLKNTGQKIIFRGADNPSKIKSTKFKKGYAKFIWFEEADEFYGMEEIRNINQSLMRGGNNFVIFYSYNPPRSISSWVNTESIKNRPDKKVYESTYLDVPEDWLGNQFFTEAEYLKNSDYDSYKHEYLGVPTGNGGEVFKNIIIRKISEDEIKSFEHLSRGLDWGYANDSLHYTVNNFDRKKRRLFIFYEIHAVGLSNRSAAELIKAENKDNGVIICDSAEPKSIAELNYEGLNAIGAKKGKGSIDYGIKWLQGMDEIIIDSQRCPYTAKEFLEYELEKDDYGGFRAFYPDKNNHSIDAVRYSRQFDMDMVKVR
jgi:PBSX family phage terminase large subunit